MSPDIARQIADSTHLRAAQHRDVKYHARADAYYYPADEFEAETGLTGIATHYALPEGETPESLFMQLYPLVVQVSLLKSYLRHLEPYPDGITADALHGQAAHAQTCYEQHIYRVIENRHSLDEYEKEDDLMTAREMKQHAEEWQDMAQLADKTGYLHPAEIQRALGYAQAHFTRQAQSCYAEVEALNPELNALTPQIENNDQRWNVLHGILSYFNVADIHHFSIKGQNLVDSLEDKQWARRHQQIEAQSGVRIGWVPAPSTQLRILEQLRQREPATAIAR